MSAPATVYVLHCEMHGLVDMNEVKELVRSKRKEHEYLHYSAKERAGVTICEYALVKQT